jgi:hypothetical protein
MTAAAPPIVRGRRTSRRLVIAAVLLAALAGVAVVLYDLESSGPSAAANIDNEYPTSIASVTRQSLSSETQVSATLGYAGASTISVPSGTAPSSVTQAQQAVTGDESQLSTAQATEASDQTALAQVHSTLAADSAKQAVDCGGDNAAQAAAAGGSGSSGGGGGGACATDAQAVAQDRLAVTQDEAKVSADARAASAAETALAGAQANLTAAETSATAYGQGATYTMLPAVGAVIHRGQVLYGVNGTPVVLLYGSTAPWRAFTPGMTPGPDVAELNAGLGLSGDAFTGATAGAIDAFQSVHGLPATGSLALGTVVFEPGPVRVTAVTPTPGSAVQAGPVLSVTTTKRVVTIELDAAQQSSVKVGDPVSITLPDNSTTPGRVSYVGTVATAPAASDQSGGGGGNPTIEVDVTPTHPGATGHLDQAPVNVSIITATVRDALVVPVNALVALSSGGYAIEVASASGHHLVAVNLGLFDDADGLVQVTGAGVAPGQRVVVPSP